MPANVSSPFLAERLIARLSPLRRGNLARRIREDVTRLEPEAGSTIFGGPLVKAALKRKMSMLGRLAALTA